MAQPTDFNGILAKISNPKLREFHRQGLAYIRETQAAVAIKAGTPEFVAWAAYFERIGCPLPQTFRMAIADTNREFTAPAQWPEWFDHKAAPQIEQREAAE